MEDIHKYLYVLDYESIAYRAGYEIEQANKLDYSEGIDCTEHPELYSECSHAFYLLKTINNTVKSLQRLL